MKLRTCNRCNLHFLHTEPSCPHCGVSTPSRRKGLGLALLMGIGMVACGEKEDDTASDTAEDTAIIPEPSAEEEYGVPAVSGEGDVWTGDED